MKNEIQQSWDKNVDEWDRIIESNQIPSRKFTNQAIIYELKELDAFKILDCGCGEGWLTRAVTSLGKKAIGIDSTVGLIAKAKAKSNNSFYTLSYEEIIDGKTIPELPFDAVVFNFCLYQKENLSILLKKIKNMLVPGGYIIIQTLHPYFLVQNGHGYTSQWLTDSWKGLPGNFVEGHSWYARTFEDWNLVFTESDLKTVQIKEVLNSEKQPISIIYTLQ